MGISDCRLVEEKDNQVTLHFRSMRYTEMSHMEATDELDMLVEYHIENFGEVPPSIKNINYGSAVGDKGYCSITLSTPAVPSRPQRNRTTPLIVTSASQIRTLDHPITSEDIMQLEVMYSLEREHTKAVCQMYCTCLQDPTLTISFKCPYNSTLYYLLKQKSWVRILATLENSHLANNKLFINPVHAVAFKFHEPVTIREHVVFEGIKQNDRVVFSDVKSPSTTYLWLPSRGSKLLTALKSARKGQQLVISASLEGQATDYTYRIKNVKRILPKT